MMNTLRRIAPSLRCRHPRVPVIKPEAADDLPASVLAVLNRAMVHRRRCDANGARRVRVIVQLLNSQGWYHGPEATRKAIAIRFPELSAEQIDEASSLLQSIVNAHLRVLNRQERGANWATNW